MGKIVKVEISARHIHISRQDLDILFGENYELTKYKDLSQEGEFASNEKVDLISENGKIEGVRILGPVREKTQVELSLSDARILKMSVPIRISGDVENTPGIVLKGASGQVILESGVIVAKRHFHCSEETAEELGLKIGDNVKVKIESIRSLVFDNIEVRIEKNFNDAVHLDTDEGNACTIDGVCVSGEIVEN